MNTSAEVTLAWGDGTYLFALRPKQIDELQRLCRIEGEPGSGALGSIARRLFGGVPTIQDILHTIRLGLVGGGMPAIRAAQLVEQYVHGQRIANPDDPSGPLKTAVAVMGAAWFGLDELDGSTKDADPDGEGLEEVNVASLRASAVRMGIPPGDFERMSLYEFFSTAEEYAKAQDRAGGKAPPPSDESLEESIERVRAMNLPDVQLH